MLKIRTSVPTFAIGDRVTLVKHNKPFTVDAISGPNLYVIGTGVFGETIPDVPGYLLQPAEAEILMLARKVA